jgi:hypothetical protein
MSRIQNDKNSMTRNLNMCNTQSPTRLRLLRPGLRHFKVYIRLVDACVVYVRLVTGDR